MALNVTDYLPYFFTPACTFLYHLKKKKKKKKVLKSELFLLSRKAMDEVERL